MCIQQAIAGGLSTTIVVEDRRRTVSRRTAISLPPGEDFQAVFHRRRPVKCGSPDRSCVTPEQLRFFSRRNGWYRRGAQSAFGSSSLDSIISTRLERGTITRRVATTVVRHFHQAQIVKSIGSIVALYGRICAAVTTIVPQYARVRRNSVTEPMR